jgi:uncharacterized RDD family membrane protein YckC
MNSDNPYAPPTSQLTGAPSPVEGVELANRFTRLVAAFLDGLCAGLPVLLLYTTWGFISYVIARREAMPAGAELAAPVLVFLAFAVINCHFLKICGQTIGKRLTGTRIIGMDGRVPHFARVILLRYFPIWLVSLIPYAGIVFVLLDALFMIRSDRRCIHDWIASTKVVKVRRSNPVDPL